MKEIAKEVIEIGGVEYNLFLNRKGIVAWEKYGKEEGIIVRELTKKAQSVELSSDIKEDTNPFEGLDILDELNENSEVVTKYYQKLYWIMLYENHKLSFEKAKELYNQACKEYGEDQIIQLGTQMIEDANAELIKEQEQATELKNLKALRPTR